MAANRSGVESAASSVPACLIAGLQLSVKLYFPVNPLLSTTVRPVSRWKGSGAAGRSGTPDKLNLLHAIIRAHAEPARMRFHPADAFVIGFALLQLHPTLRRLSAHTPAARASHGAPPARTAPFPRSACYEEHPRSWSGVSLATSAASAAATLPAYVEALRLRPGRLVDQLVAIQPVIPSTSIMMDRNRFLTPITPSGVGPQLDPAARASFLFGFTEITSSSRHLESCAVESSSSRSRPQAVDCEAAACPADAYSQNRKPPRTKISASRSTPCLCYLLLPENTHRRSTLHPAVHFSYGVVQKGTSISSSRAKIRLSSPGTKYRQ